MTAKHWAALAAFTTLFAIYQSSAQKAGDWQFGLTLQPSFFRMYNDYDWKEHGYKPDVPSKFNALAFGVLAERAISDRFGLGAELNYSRQHQQYYTRLFQREELDGSTTYFSILSAKIRLDYLKLPLLAVYNLEIGNGSGLFLKLGAGPQVSFCTDYYGKNTKFAYNLLTDEVDYNSWNVLTSYSPFRYHHDLLNSDGTHAINDENTKYLYRRLELGVVGGVSLQKSFLGNYGISIGARFEQGLTDIENPDEDKWHITLAGQTGFYQDRPPTHTRRMVLSIGVSKTLE